MPQKCLDLCASLSFQQHSVSFHGMKQDPVPGHLPVSASCFLQCLQSGVTAPLPEAAAHRLCPHPAFILHLFSFNTVYLLRPDSSYLLPRFLCQDFLLAALGDSASHQSPGGECQQIHAAWSWFSGLIFCLESSLFLASKYTICETLKVQDLLLGVGLMIFCLNSFFPPR